MLSGKIPNYPKKKGGGGGGGGEEVRGRRGAELHGAHYTHYTCA